MLVPQYKLTKVFKIGVLKLELDILTSEGSKNDSNGTLKVKVYLKQADKYYTAAGELVEDKDTAGKEVTLSGFKNTSQELETKAKAWYDALPATFAADTESAKKLASEFKDETAIKGLIDKIATETEKAKFTAPTSPDGFTVSYSFVLVEDVTSAGTTTTTLKFKALLKNGESSFDGTDGKIKANASGKEVSVTGFTSEETFALTTYKSLTEDGNLTLVLSDGEQATALKAKLASQITEDTDYTNLNEALKVKLDSLNASLVDSGFKFEIIKVTSTTGTNWDNTTGSLQVQLLLSSGTGTDVKYWKLNVTDQESTELGDSTVEAVTDKTTATGRYANVDGFTTGEKYLKPLLESFSFKQTFTSDDVANIEKLSKVFDAPADTNNDTRLKDMVDSLNALKTSDYTNIDPNAVVGYKLSATAGENKFSVNETTIDGKLATVSGQFKLTADNNAPVSTEAITIKSSSDFAEYTPHFMSVKVPTTASDIVSAGATAKNIHLGIDNFDSYASWSSLTTKAVNLFKDSDAKLDTFSNALGARMVEAALENTTLTETTQTYYINPYPMNELPSTVQAKSGKNTVNGIGSNKTTLLLAGFGGYTGSGSSVKENGKPWPNQGDGLSKNYFDYKNVKWYFYGLYEANHEGSNNGARITRSLLNSNTKPVSYAPTGSDTVVVANPNQYVNNTAIAIRFLLEAIITNDTMSRSTGVDQQE
ncbi:hypothetical protein ACA758_04030 [Mycoplasmopsis agassizii]|uniref:hypothetical protein n=1 Tax=Mycoplasmopsis agassizii TaxID=33922 RepID=UPI0035299A7B